MAEQGIQIRFDRLARDFERMAEEFPARRARVIGAIGSELQRELQRLVPVEERGIKRPPGTIRDGQDKFFGSGGGYVAIRPREGTAPQNGGSRRDSYGVITAALEGGHGITGSTADVNQYVTGRFFYRTMRTGKRAEAIAQRHLDALRAELIEEMNRT